MAKGQPQIFVLISSGTKKQLAHKRKLREIEKITKVVLKKLEEYEDFGQIHFFQFHILEDKNYCKAPKVNLKGLSIVGTHATRKAFKEVV